MKTSCLFVLIFFALTSKALDGYMAMRSTKVYNAQGEIIENKTTINKYGIAEIAYPNKFNISIKDYENQIRDSISFTENSNSIKLSIDIINTINNHFTKSSGFRCYDLFYWPIAMNGDVKEIIQYKPNSNNISTKYLVDTNKLTRISFMKSHPDTTYVSWDNKGNYTSLRNNIKNRTYAFSNDTVKVFKDGLPYSLNYSSENGFTRKYYNLNGEISDSLVLKTYKNKIEKIDSKVKLLSRISLIDNHGRITSVNREFADEICTYKYSENGLINSYRWNYHNYDIYWKFNIDTLEDNCFVLTYQRILPDEKNTVRIKFDKEHNVVSKEYLSNGRLKSIKTEYIYN